jgi:hypothetical protein
MILLPAIFLLSFNLPDSPLTKNERDYAIDQLTKSKNHLLGAVKGLSKEQLNFKPTPESWSIAECTEHLAISETAIYGMVEGALAQPSDPSKRSDVKMTDEQVVAMITDRSKKIKTTHDFEPSGKFGSYENSLKEFSSKRDSHIDYVKKTADDLRNRYQQMPFATLDAYQVILFMAGHSERHTRQIEEVKADPNFPKK